MTIYKVYTRSIVVGIISAIVYAFIGLVLFGMALEQYPDYLDNDDDGGWYLLGLIVFCYLVYLLARATARRTIKVGIIGKKMIARYSKTSIYSDFELPFYQVKSYKYIQKWYGDRLKLQLADGTKLILREKYMPFLKNRTYQEFIDLFIKNYETGSNSVPAFREQLDSYSISESAISGFAPGLIVDRNIPQPTENPLPEPPVETVLPVRPPSKTVISSHIRARRSLRFQLVIWLAVIAFVGEATFLITAYNSTRYVELIICSIIALIALYTIAVYFSNAPGVETDNIGITVKGKTHYWRDIKKMQLTGAQPYKFIFPSTKEGMMLQFAGGSTLYLYDHLRANLTDIRECIQQKTGNKS